jgi:hypothetical protein
MRALSVLLCAGAAQAFLAPRLVQRPQLEMMSSTTTPTGAKVQSCPLPTPSNLLVPLWMWPCHPRPPLGPVCALPAYVPRPEAANLPRCPHPPSPHHPTLSTPPHRSPSRSRRAGTRSHPPSAPHTHAHRTSLTWHWRPGPSRRSPRPSPPPASSTRSSTCVRVCVCVCVRGSAVRGRPRAWRGGRGRGACAHRIFNNHDNHAHDSHPLLHPPGAPGPSRSSPPPTRPSPRCPR